MKSRRFSEGFVLVFSLILALCAGLILAGEVIKDLVKNK